MFGGCGHQLPLFRFGQGLLALVVRIWQPDQTLLAGINRWVCAPGGAIGPVPQAWSLQVCCAWVNIHQPAKLRQQLFPLLQLLRALLISVAELLQQVDGFDCWGLLGAGLLQFRSLVPEFVDSIGRKTPDGGGFRSS